MLSACVVNVQSRKVVGIFHTVGNPARTIQYIEGGSKEQFEGATGSIPADRNLFTWLLEGKVVPESEYPAP